jgi:hypothetical protein
MTDDPIHRICCVCGAPLPKLSMEDIMKKRAVTLRGDGSRLYHCPKHTLQELIDSQSEITGFRRASELVK